MEQYLEKGPNKPNNKIGRRNWGRMIATELQSYDVKDNHAEILNSRRFKQMMELIRLIILF